MQYLITPYTNITVKLLCYNERLKCYMHVQEHNYNTLMVLV